MWTRRDGLTLVLTCVASAGLLGMGDCGKQGDPPPTAPEIPSAPAAPPTTAQAPAPTEVAPPTGDSGIHINQNGTITLSIDETLTACFYIPPYGAGVLVKGWKVSMGRTEMPWKNDSCDPVEGQIEIIDKATCPPKPPQEYLDARIITIRAGKTKEECTECEEPDVWTEKPGSRKTVEGPWGECPLSASTTEEQCYECRTVTETWTETNCDNERPASKTTPERREIECECVEDPTTTTSTVCGEWNECHEHPTALHASTTSGGCFQEKLCVETTTIDYKCKADVETKREYEETQPCECVCVDNPSGSVGHDAGSNPYLASASFEDSGQWTLRISASSRESECTSNQPDYWKRTVKKTLECDEQGSLNASYSWAGHRAEWWRSVLLHNGQVVDQTACVRNPFN